MSELILVRKIKHNLWQWREVAAGEWRSDAFYTGDINLLKEAIEHKAVWLVVPGSSVVSQRVPVDIKDRKQLLKILPYEIEETIVDPVEDMHFVFGGLRDDTIPVIYADLEWLQNCISEVEATGAEVVRCGVDYLQLPRADGGWTLLLENDQLLAHTDEGVGFAVERSMAALYLADLAAAGLPAALQLYGDCDESLQTLNNLLPAALNEAEEPLTVEAQEAGFWDLIPPGSPLRTELRSGKLSRPLPFEQWWKAFKYPIVAAAAGLVLALGSAWFGSQQAENQRRQIMAQTDAIFRQVVPEGVISDPARQLRNMLGSGGGGGRQSNAVVLLAGVAPALKSHSDVKVRSFRYSHDNGQLQLNIEANSFDTFEALRSKIAEAGFSVDIRSASVYGDVHQAQIRVSGAG